MIKHLAKRGLRRLLELGQTLGLDITPRHFYSEIPDLRALRREQLWRRPFSMRGIAGTDLDRQLAFVRDCVDACRPRLERGGILERARARQGEPGFGPAEATLLAAFVARWRPSKVVQIGCGVATAVIEEAAGASGYEPELVCVEPAPSRYLEEAAREGRLRLHDVPAQTLPLATLSSLPADGLLFVDSSHTLRPGSEVPRLVLEVLPVLQPGTWVHFHDVYFPFDYSPTILDGDLFFRHESLLLQAFLTDNPHFEVLAAMSMLHHGRPRELADLLPGFVPCPMQEGVKAGAGQYPSSLYLRVVPRRGAASAEGNPDQ